MWDVIGKVAVAVVAAKLIWSVLKGIYGSFLASALGLTLNVKKTGEWAVVTGATDGIGKAYAFELARRGLKIILVSRSPFKLQNVAAEINSKYGVETKIIDVDFTNLDIYGRLETELSNVDIGVLVNNVGMGFDHPQYFTEIEDCEKTCERFINCNIVSLTHMTRIVLPRMVERKRGLVVNVASLTSTIPAPLLSIYAATKAYVQSLSESLAIECGRSGVTVQCIVPGFVATKMSKIRRPTLMAPTPTAYVRTTMKTVGVESFTGGYYMHKLQVYVIEVVKTYLPGWVLASIVFYQLSNVRKRAFKRKEREAKQE